MGGKRLRLQQRRICAIYIDFCGDPTRWYIEEMHCQLLIPVWVGNGFPDLWECTFSRLYWFFQFLRACVLRLCWLISWWGVIVAALVATYILGICWRYFLEQFENWRKKRHLIAMACPLPPRSAPPPPRPHIYEGEGLQVERLFELEICPPTSCRDQWPLMVPPPPPTPSWEEPAGVLEIRTGYLKIDSVGIFFRKIPAFPRTCYTPSPSPPSCHGGGGWSEGCTAFPILKGNYIELSNFGIYHMND
jgi:hypothetical protein